MNPNVSLQVHGLTYGRGEARYTDLNALAPGKIEIAEISTSFSPHGTTYTHSCALSGIQILAMLVSPLHVVVAGIYRTLKV